MKDSFDEALDLAESLNGWRKLLAVRHGEDVELDALDRHSYVLSEFLGVTGALEDL